MRLIDADALGNRMYHESFEKDSDLQRWDGGCWIRYKLFEQVLRAAPTIDLTHPTSSNTNVPDTNVGELINRQDAIDLVESFYKIDKSVLKIMVFKLKQLPSVQSTTLTEDDKETIRIHLSAFKERLCNQRRWNEAKEYEELISRLLSTPSAQPERKKGKWLKAGTRMGIPLFECSLCECGEEVPTVMGKPSYNFCPNCGCRMEEGDFE